jgi:hypothetical protein
VHQIKRLIFAALVVAATSSPTNAATSEEAFAAGCGGCHPSERGILRKIPPGTEPERRAWILNFMAGHPNEREALKPEILEYLLRKSAIPKRWWEFW